MDKHYLMSGDAMNPDEHDLIGQTQTLRIDLVPPGEGWRIMTGNARRNQWARVAYRYEIEIENDLEAAKTKSVES